MNSQKELWEKLANQNSKYYINSDHGKGITERQFIKSGFDDFVELIIDDELITSRNSLLEIGCGNGRMTMFIACLFELVIGVDISKNMIEEGRERLPMFENLALIETDGNSFSVIIEDSIDVVFSYIVFQHFKTKEMVEANFKEAYRVLKQDGIFKVRIRTDNVDKKMKRWWAGVSYSEEEVAELSNNIGFKILKTEEVKDYGLWLWLKK